MCKWQFPISGSFVTEYIASIILHGLISFLCACTSESTYADMMPETFLRNFATPTLHLFMNTPKKVALFLEGTCNEWKVKSDIDIEYPII